MTYKIQQSRRTPIRRPIVKRRAPIVTRPPFLYSALVITYQRVGDVTRVTAASALAGALYFWYVDGSYVATTTSGTRDFSLAPGDQARVEVLVSTDESFDPIANAPDGGPARRSLWWVRSTDADVDRYTVEEKVGAGAYAVVAVVSQASGAWALGWTSARLTDLATYTWRVTPYDRAGNAGTPRVFGPELVVRRPDAPSFTAAVAAGLVTFTGAP